MTRFVLMQASAAEWLGVEWGSIGLVFVVGLIATLLIVGLYTAGIRLRSCRQRPDSGGIAVSR